MSGVPYKYNYEITLTKVSHLKSVLDFEKVVAVWERRNVVESTEPTLYVTAEGGARFKSPLTFSTTLFKEAESDKHFAPKKGRLSLKTNSADGPTVAKCHLDLATFTKGPAGTNSLLVNFTDKAKVDGKISWKLRAKGAADNGSDTDSLTSARTSGSAGLSVAGDSGDDIAGGERGGDSLEEANRKLKDKVDSLERSIKRVEKHVEKVEQEMRGDSRSSVVGKRMDESLDMKLNALKNTKMGLEDTQASLLEELVEVVQESRGLPSEERLGALKGERARLRREIEELEGRLNSPLSHMDLVRELTNVKMEFAEASTFKEQIQFEIKNLEKAAAKKSKGYFLGMY
mmetsp:Transcript_28930/g.72691  ORF Transcript_28930/g.72691 Transcript_28930/m.72691 type:complete len:344 (-) Transcript_28930:170-1201(-)|eukprot:CAMPEP_0174885006 /NCGR_PEP_ID=MMETSP0167-20121228/391_1 /TAXON_ID=38298 /ORGANISM="Rhodella maculata, Strain CCMP736" /LENGTH=343 /DNA_ID=CAMNT_0016120501 /DNA_START=138 /DNA_END=1169 /DNA_ORIENTATION=-